MRLVGAVLVVLVLLAAGVVLYDPTHTGLVSHEVFSSFASPEGRSSLAGGSFSFVDDAVFRTAYYSVNSGAWVPFSLSGEPYVHDPEWLSSVSAYSLPAPLLGSGEHYIIVYSCSHDDGAWDCHGSDSRPAGFWQLLVIDNNDASVVLGDGPDELPTLVAPPVAVDSSMGADIGVPHERFPSFASPESRVYSQDGLLVSLADPVTLRTAYYSLDGYSWQPVNLSGSEYEDHEGWIRGDAVLSLPGSFDAPGDHYVALFSCYKEFLWEAVPWDCHGGWQLVVVNGAETDAEDPYALVRLEGADPTCGNHFDYQCGARTVCGEELQFGSCSEGYDCVENLCIARDDLSCDGVVCADGEYCSRGVCLLDVSGSTYFVAPWGDDSSPGTYDEPFYSWQRGAEAMGPGGIVYIRGGVWYPSTYIGSGSTIGLDVGTSYTSSLGVGSKDAPLRFYNFPGERPILDGSRIGPSPTRWLSGIAIGKEYVYLRGLTVRHLHQSPPDFGFEWKPYSEVFGIGSDGANHHFENVVVHDIDGRGFQHWSSAWSHQDAQYSYDLCVAREEAEPDGDPSSCVYETPLYASDESSWVNCDAYNLFDRYASEPGNAADGWKVGTYEGGTFTWDGCRAWNYSDDGFDPHGSGTRIFRDCWASSLNYFADITPMWGTEGNGFKTTGPEGVVIAAEEHNVVFDHCIAADDYGHGQGSGFITNLLTSEEYSSNPLVVHNLAYRDGHSYSGLRGGTVMNNIAYATRNLGPTGEPNIVSGRLPYTESHNTWIFNDPRPGSWPWFYVNPAYSVTDEDFVSLDVSQLQRPRKTDGSLPEVEFGHLAADSELVDGGVVIEGYHCPTNGSHEGEDCVEWYGLAPDLGPFERR